MKIGIPHTRHAMALACCKRTGLWSLKSIADRAALQLVGRHQACGVNFSDHVSELCLTGVRLAPSNYCQPGHRACKRLLPRLSKLIRTSAASSND
jgi:hypothetical protein